MYRFARFSDRIIGYFDFMTPMYVVRDPNIFRQLAIKEFDSFEDHKFLLNTDVEPLFGNSVFLMCGQKWREMRATLSPAFTGSKMRLMFDFVRDCATNTTQHLHQINGGANGALSLELGDMFARYASDVIATCAFGVTVDSFADRNNEFFVQGKKISDTSPRTVGKFVLQRVAPSVMKWLRLEYFDMGMKKFFCDMITRNMETRRRLGIRRPDMVDLLLTAQQGAVATTPNEARDDTTAIDDGFAVAHESSIGRAKVHRKWTDVELLAQTFTFYLAGYDTTTAVLVATAYELMLHPHVQQRLIDEIDECQRQLNGAPLTYEQLQRLTYLDMVISETLRILPPGPFVDRVCTKDFRLTIDDGRVVEFKVGDQLWVPISAFHHDPQYFPQPDQFDPERFSELNRGNINPAWYMPFGAGPRNCIGSRFALMVIKVVVYELLANYTLQANANTQIPMKMKSMPTGMYPEKGLHMNLCRRK